MVIIRTSHQFSYNEDIKYVVNEHLPVVIKKCNASKIIIIYIHELQCNAMQCLCICILFRYVFKFEVYFSRFGKRSSMSNPVPNTGASDEEEKAYQQQNFMPAVST
jgi:hypothetical protein